MAKKPEEMTLDEVKEQLALYTKLYYRFRTHDDTDFVKRKRASALKHYHKKRLQRLLSEGKAELDNDGKIVEINPPSANN